MIFDERRYEREPDPRDVLSPFQQGSLNHFRDLHEREIATRYWNDPIHLRRLFFARYLVQQGLLSDWDTTIEPLAGD